MFQFIHSLRWVTTALYPHLHAIMDLGVTHQQELIFRTSWNTHDQHRAFVIYLVKKGVFGGFQSWLDYTVSGEIVVERVFERKRF